MKRKSEDDDATKMKPLTRSPHFRVVLLSFDGD